MAKNRTDDDVAQELRKFVRAAPFSSFDIRTTDGDTFSIVHPDFIAIAPTGRMAVAYAKGEDTATVINLRHVVSISPTRQRKGMLGSGGGKK